MNIESAQVATELEIPEISVVPKSGYSDLWVSVADGIYKYRPMLPGRKRMYRSLKTTNLKIAKERYHSLCSQNGSLAESKLTVGDIISRYDEGGLPSHRLAKFAKVILLAPLVELSRATLLRSSPSRRRAGAGSVVLRERRICLPARLNRA
jgi:hypothetical protein